MWSTLYPTDQLVDPWSIKSQAAMGSGYAAVAWPRLHNTWQLCLHYLHCYVWKFSPESRESRMFTKRLLWFIDKCPSPLVVMRAAGPGKWLPCPSLRLDCSDSSVASVVQGPLPPASGARWDNLIQFGFSDPWNGWLQILKVTLGGCLWQKSRGSPSWLPRFETIMCLQLGQVFLAACKCDAQAAESRLGRRGGGGAAGLLFFAGKVLEGNHLKPRCFDRKCHDHVAIIHYNCDAFDPNRISIHRQRGLVTGDCAALPQWVTGATPFASWQPLVHAHWIAYCYPRGWADV